MEPGESDTVALAREVREETGLEVAVGAWVGRVERSGPSALFDIHDYACSVTGGDLRAGDDALDAAWLDGATFATLRASGQVVAQLAETLAQWGELPR